MPKKPGLARARAEAIAMLLEAGGLRDIEYAVSWAQGPAADGNADWEFRSSDVGVLP